MASEIGNAPSKVANVNSVDVVSEADPALRQPPALQDLIDETLLPNPGSPIVSLSDTAHDEQTPLLGKPRQEKFKPWYRQAAPKL